MATLITMALTGQSAVNNERPESTPKPARMGWRRTKDGGGGGGAVLVERSSVIGM
jgi:hypothetical protein